MGVDCIQSRKGRPTRKAPKSGNHYLLLLVKLYRLLSRRTSSSFNKVILKRLCMSKIHRPPVSLSSLARRLSKFKNEKPTLVVVGTVTNDERLVDLPKMRVVALKFTREAYRKIISAGGSCLNFDAFARENPLGKNTCLMQGKRTARTACKYFGKAPGLPGSHARPRVQSVGRKFENGPRRRKMH